MSKFTDDLIFKLKNLTDEQIERLADAVDKVTPEEAAKWANLERHTERAWKEYLRREAKDI